LFPAMKKYVPKGEKVVFFSDHKVNSYGDLVALAKKYNAKTVTEVHFDAHTLGSSARGGHVIVHSNFKPDKVDLALRDAIKKMVGVRYSHKGYEGISGRNNLYNVNVAAQNGVNYRLIELGFGTNKTDADIMIKKVDEYAKELIKAVTGGVVSKSNTNTSTSNKKPTTSDKTNSKKYTSIVDYLKDNNIDSSFANRKKLATKHGIKNYTGTAAQNAKLLSILQGAKVTNKTSSNKTQAKGTVHLPASAKTWRTYKLNVQPVAKNSDWSLTPSRYGGLTYTILGRPYPDVVTINTSKGKRNIYVGKGTGAVVK